MNKILDNINEIVTAKNEMKNILIALGMKPTDKLETYVDLFRQALEISQIQTEEILG